MDPCAKYQEMISAMLDGEIDNNDREELMAHISECSDCRLMLEAFTAISDEIGEMAEVPEGFSAAVMKEIKPKRAIIRWQRYAAMAACLVLVVSAGIKTAMPAAEEAAMLARGAAYSTTAAMPEAAPMMPAPESAPMEKSIEAHATASPMSAASYAPVADTAPEPEEADLAYPADEISLSGANIPQLVINSGGLSFGTSEANAKELLSNLNFGHETEAPETEPEITLGLADGNILELWRDGDSIICRLDGLAFVPAGDPETINSIIDDIID